jgi:soluble lytic murein transglycosylase-like protein
MFNIRKETMDKVAVFSMYALLIAGLPHAIANADEVDGSTVTVQEIAVDPLDKYKGAKELSDTDLVELLSAVGFEGKALKVAYAVAKKESNGRPLAHNGDVSTGDNSYGIFQINMLGSLGEERREKFQLKTNKDLLEPVTNAKIAYHMSNGGEDWSSWKVYPGQKNGERYESFLKKFPN